jgi:hypothetical protein
MIWIKNWGMFSATIYVMKIKVSQFLNFVELTNKNFDNIKSFPFFSPILHIECLINRGWQSPYGSKTGFLTQPAVPGLFFTGFYSTSTPYYG